MRTSFRLIAVGVILGLGLAGCGIFRSASNNKAKIPGERLPVLAFEQGLEVDQSLAQIPIIVPAPTLNADWPQMGGSPAKAMQHVVLPERLTRAWTARIGEGDSRGERLVSTPVVAQGMLYAIDTRARVIALDAKTGRQIWQKPIERREVSKRVAFGGGVAFFEGRLFVTTGYGIAVALDAKTGAEIWRKTYDIPLRGAPTIAQGRVLIITQDNQVFALNADDGADIWDNVGIAETAGILGAASPAVSGDTVIVGFSSGELSALRLENGRNVWQDNLARSSRLTALESLADIDGAPVVDRGRVFAIGHGGRMVALELTTGERVWDKSLGGISTPWVAGEYIYIITTEGELICLTRSEGRIRWITPLQRFKDPEDRDGFVRWQGPVLASDRLIATASNGFMASFSPYTGALISVEKLPSGTWLPPIVADTMLYVLTREGEIVAYR
jgi:outer membrane protein assembly factor BamB